ncbi:MAG: hypothetical protein KC964_31485, partial [Candidatus Omnitrophica bacterium]|nr:hypothetical protein [Candidatus Omnitrophota bacterium]
SAMGQAMLLDTKEREILGTLEVGKAVVKLQGRGTKPFLIEIPEFPLTKGVLTDEGVAKRMGRVVLEPAFINATSPSIEATPTSTPAPTDPVQDDLSQKFLKDIADNPESGVANRYKRLGISVRQGQKLKARLVEEGLIEDKLETSEKGTKRVVRLTEQGDQALVVKPEA